MAIQVTVHAESAPERGHDRHAVLHHPGATVLAIADGAGGSSGAADAAALLVEALVALGDPGASVLDPTYWFEWLYAQDNRLYADPGAGETTGLVVAVGSTSPGGPLQVAGAAVGDSRAWILGEDRSVDLTRNAEARPRLGSGRAVPAAFVETLGGGTLLLGSDGLWGPLEPAEIASLVLSMPPAAALRMVAQLLRTRHGELPDDLTGILAQDEGREG